MAQGIRRLTSNQKIGGSNLSVVDFLFDTKEVTTRDNTWQLKSNRYKPQNTWAHGPTDKASDFESEEWGFESFCG